ncbi:MAG: toll/interleukin-1 receptor domain-containing protein [Pseudomonadota bacterium]
MLTHRDLSGAAFSGADLRRVNLRRATLIGTDFTGANLADADLRATALQDSYAWGANLIHANLSSADLRNTDLRNADLSYANLSNADLAGAKLDGAKLGMTVLTNMDLRPLCRAANLEHGCESTTDYLSVVRSIAEPNLKPFLRRIGMPDVFIEYMVDCARTLDPQQIFSMFQSTFISYGGPDEAFARKLNDALERRGVTTFFFKEDAPAGEKLHRVMRKGVNEHDRVILVCSESSLQRRGLLNELEETLARESRDGGRAYLLPIRLDDYVINGWKPADPDVAQAVRDRVIADFREHGNPGQFEAEVSKLIAVLKRPGPLAHV